MRKQLAFVAVAVLAIAAWIFVETPAGSAQAKRVVVSIKPIHSLVAAVMQGVGTPELLVPGALPTTLPAGAEAKLAEADLVLWIGPSLEKFMERAVLLRRQGAVAIALLDAPGVRHMALPNNTPSAVVVAPRPPPKKAEEKPPVAKVEPPKSAPPKAATPAKKSKPDDDSYDPEAEKKPVPSEKVEAGQPPGQPPTAQTPPERKTLVVPRTDDKAAKSPDDEPDGDEPGDGDTAKAAKPADPRPVGPRLDPGTHLTRKRPDPKEVKKEDLQVGNPDPYIWLDPRNAVALVRAIAGTLSQIDPANARLYQRNAAALIANIESVEAEITGLVGEVDTRPFASVNQSFQYFEANFVMRPRSRINFGSMSPPAERINDARDRLRREEVACVFYPAAFDPRAVTGLVNGISTRAAPIDPFGAGVEPGPDAYYAIMRKIAETYVECLAARRR